MGNWNWSACVSSWQSLFATRGSRGFQSTDKCVTWINIRRNSILFYNTFTSKVYSLLEDKIIKYQQANWQSRSTYAYFAKQLLKKKLLRGNFEYCRVSVIISPKRKFTLQYFLSCPGKGGYEWLSIFDRLVFPIRLWGPFNSFVVNSVYIRTIFCRCVTRMWMSQRCTSWHDLLMLWVQTPGTKPRVIMWLLVGGVAVVQAPP